MSFQNRTVIITGASRGIGKAIGLKLAAAGANIVIASKSVEENPKLGGTIFSAAAEMEQAGGKALAIQCDIRFEDQIQHVIDKTVEAFKEKGFKAIRVADLLQKFELGELSPETIKDTLVLMPSGELSRARGGFHCMSMPLQRDKVL